LRKKVGASGYQKKKKLRGTGRAEGGGNFLCTEWESKALRPKSELMPGIRGEALQQGWGGGSKSGR